MPIYAFECAACGHGFDRLQKLSDADPSACPVCGQEQVKRQLTAPQFRLSGGGWYETDFKKDGDKKRNLAGEGGAPGASSDAKPAETTSGERKAGDKSTADKVADSKPVEKKTEPAPKAESKPASPAS